MKTGVMSSFYKPQSQVHRPSGPQEARSAEVSDWLHHQSPTGKWQD